MSESKKLFVQFNLANGGTIEIPFKYTEEQNTFIKNFLKEVLNKSESKNLKDNSTTSKNFWKQLKLQNPKLKNIAKINNILYVPNINDDIGEAININNITIVTFSVKSKTNEIYPTQI